MVSRSEYYGMTRLNQPWLGPRKRKISEIRERLEGLITGGLGEPSGAYAEARNRELAAQMRSQAQLATGAERRLSENLAGRGMTYSGMYKEGAVPIQQERFARIAELQRGAATDIAGREAQDRALAISQGMQWEQQEQQRRDRLLGIGLRGGLSAAPAGRKLLDAGPKILGVLRPSPNLEVKRRRLQELEEQLRQLMERGAWGDPNTDYTDTFRPDDDWPNNLA